MLPIYSLADSCHNCSHFSSYMPLLHLCPNPVLQYDVPVCLLHFCCSSSIKGVLGDEIKNLQVHSPKLGCSIDQETGKEEMGVGKKSQLPHSEETSATSPETTVAPVYKRNRSTSAIVGPEGGTLNLYGVFLKIPPAALTEEKKITLGITRAQCHQMHLNDRTAVLSPVVSCELHGLHF